MDFNQLKELIADSLGVSKEEVKMESDLAQDLGADSLDAVELIMSIEDEFDITIDDDAAQTFKTVEQIVKYIESKE